MTTNWRQGRAEGDAAAFQILLERHYDSVYRIAFRFSGLREDAEDIAQDVCACLVLKLRSFKGDASSPLGFTGWWVNAVRDLQRKQASAGRVNRDYSELQDLARGEEQEAAKEIAWLYGALDAVGENLRETAVLVLG